MYSPWGPLFSLGCCFSLGVLLLSHRAKPLFILLKLSGHWGCAGIYIPLFLYEIYNVLEDPTQNSTDHSSPSSVCLCSPSFLVWQLMLSIFQELDLFVDQIPLKNDQTLLGISMSFKAVVAFKKIFSMCHLWHYSYPKRQLMSSAYQCEIVQATSLLICHIKSCFPQYSWGCHSQNKMYHVLNGKPAISAFWWDCILHRDRIVTHLLAPTCA